MRDVTFSLGQFKESFMYRYLLAILCTLFTHAAYALQPAYIPKEGDFVFQSLPRGDLVDAIEGTTNSLYSHVGVVIQKDGEWFVREAIGNVHDTPLTAWQARGRMQQAFDAFRLKAEFQKFVPVLVKESAAFLGRPYDFKYAMDDENIYCSELLYKAMLKGTGIRLGKLQKLGELNWKPYRQTIEEYEGGEPPLERQMITPKGLSEAPELEQVFKGY